jgi:hypothetical protein
MVEGEEPGIRNARAMGEKARTHNGRRNPRSKASPLWRSIAVKIAYRREGGKLHANATVDREAEACDGKGEGSVAITRRVVD